MITYDTTPYKAVVGGIYIYVHMYDSCMGYEPETWTRDSKPNRNQRHQSWLLLGSLCLEIL